MSLTCDCPGPGAPSPLHLARCPWSSVPATYASTERCGIQAEELEIHQEYRRLAPTRSREWRLGLRINDDGDGGGYNGAGAEYNGADRHHRLERADGDVGAHGGTVG
jgi:hypothetical protein